LPIPHFDRPATALFKLLTSHQRDVSHLRRRVQSFSAAHGMSLFLFTMRQASY
jgi:hypothetical protein